jgi:hypothetical protein
MALALGVPYQKWVWSAEHCSASAAGVLLLSGDECLGWKQTVDDLAGALSQLQVYPSIDERLRHSIGLVEVLECSVHLPNIHWGTATNQ